MNEIAIASPDAERWVKDTAATLEIFYMVGMWTVTVSWCRIISYSDKHGAHKETWSITRVHADISTAIQLALTAAMNRGDKP